MTTRLPDSALGDVEIDLRSGPAKDERLDPLVDLDASYWSLETAAARDEAMAARAELAEVQAQLVFLRAQLAEASAGERAASARAIAVEAELGGLRAMAAATSSITDSSWLELSTNRYESPVRGQELPRPAVDTSADDAPEADDDPDAVEAVEAADKVQHPRPGEHADDLLPIAEKRHRRGRR